MCYSWSGPEMGNTFKVGWGHLSELSVCLCDRGYNLSWSSGQESTFKDLEESPVVSRRPFWSLWWEALMQMINPEELQGGEALPGKGTWTTWWVWNCWDGLGKGYSLGWRVSADTWDQSDDPSEVQLGSLSTLSLHPPRFKALPLFPDVAEQGSCLP